MLIAALLLDFIGPQTNKSFLVYPSLDYIFYGQVKTGTCERISKYSVSSERVATPKLLVCVWCPETLCSVQPIQPYWLDPGAGAGIYLKAVFTSKHNVYF